jgi:hypothetical protein
MAYAKCHSGTHNHVQYVIIAGVQSGGAGMLRIWIGNFGVTKQLHFSMETNQKASCLETMGT